MQNAVAFKNKVMDCYDARKTALMQEQAELINTVREQAEAAAAAAEAEQAAAPTDQG